MTIKECLSPAMIEVVESADGAAGVIERLAGKLAEFLGVPREVIERAVLERERTRSTAFANGGAVPHCRIAGLKRFGVAVMVLRQPLPWDNEGHAVDTVMMIAGPSENVSGHLRILANTSQLLDSPALRARLTRAPNAEAAWGLLSAAEQAVEQRRSQDGMLRELRREKDNGARGDYLAEVAARFDW